MTAMIGGADRASARLAATRAGWHRVAEHMLAAARYRATGNTGLVRSPGGFRAPSLGTDARFLAVDSTELVVSGAAGTKRAPVITVRAAAEFAGVTPGDPAFWNAPFGAVRIFGQAGTVAEAAALSGDGRERVLAHATTTATGR